MNETDIKFEEFYQNMPTLLKVYDLGALVCEYINEHGDDKTNVKAFCIIEELENGDKNILVDITNLKLKEQYKMYLGHIIDGKEVLTEQYRKIESIAAIALNFGGNNAYEKFKETMREKAEVYYQYNQYIKQQEEEKAI